MNSKLVSWKPDTNGNPVIDRASGSENRKA
jgi:hypothetical protein